MEKKEITKEQLKEIDNLPEWKTPSSEEIERIAMEQFPYLIDISDKNNNIIKTKGVKPFNHAKVEKYRRIYSQGIKKGLSIKI